MPASARRVVVLPAPLGPTRPSTSPRLTASERPLTATKVPYVLVSWLTSTARSIGSSYGEGRFRVARFTPQRLRRNRTIGRRRQPLTPSLSRREGATERRALHLHLLR